MAVKVHVMYGPKYDKGMKTILSPERIIMTVMQDSWALRTLHALLNENLLFIDSLLDLSIMHDSQHLFHLSSIAIDESVAYHQWNDHDQQSQYSA